MYTRIYHAIVVMILTTITIITMLGSVHVVFFECSLRLRPQGRVSHCSAKNPKTAMEHIYKNRNMKRMEDHLESLEIPWNPGPGVANRN